MTAFLYNGYGYNGWYGPTFGETWLPVPRDLIDALLQDQVLLWYGRNKEDDYYVVECGKIVNSSTIATALRMRRWRESVCPTSSTPTMATPSSADSPTPSPSP